MRETKKEKIIRYLIVCIAIVSVIIAFRYVGADNDIQEPHYTLKAAVLHTSSSLEDSPIVAVYRYIDKEHLLITYKADRKDQNYFQLHSMKKLQKEPADLKPDTETYGVWVKESDQWVYYNEALNKEKRNEKYIKQQANSYPFRLLNDHSVIEVNSLYRGTIKIKSSGKDLHSIYSLTDDDSLLLAVFNEDLSVIDVNSEWE